MLFSSLTFSGLSFSSLDVSETPFFQNSISEGLVLELGLVIAWKKRESVEEIEDVGIAWAKNRSQLKAVQRWGI